MTSFESGVTGWKNDIAPAAEGIQQSGGKVTTDYHWIRLSLWEHWKLSLHSDASLSVDREHLNHFTRHPQPLNPKKQLSDTRRTSLWSICWHTLAGDWQVCKGTN